MAKYRKKPIVVEATQWFKNGDHPEDACTMITPDPNSITQFTPFLSEGKVVRCFKHPEISGEKVCGHCGQIMHNHGWIDTVQGGHTVCPGDWIITEFSYLGATRPYYPCKPDVFEKTYEAVTE